MKKYLFVLIFIFYSTSLLACTIRDSDRGMGHIDDASTVIMGIIEGNEEKKEFITTYPWPVLRLKIENAPCIGIQNAKVGKKFLLVSDKTHAYFIKNSIINVRTGTLKQLEEIYDFQEKLINRKDLPTGKPNIFWSYCIDDKQCTKSKDACRNLVGVNKQFQTNYMNYIKSQSKNDCKKNVIKTEKNSKCIEYFCN